MSDQIELGDRVKDQISGFEGVVVARTDWLYQCRRFAVASEKPDKDGKPLEGQWFDGPQLSVLKKGAFLAPIISVAAPVMVYTGGPRPVETASRADPKR